MPWWGVVICCVLFGAWSILCVAFGYAITMAVQQRASIAEAAKEQAKWGDIRSE